MSTRIHTTVSGHRIEYEATPKVAAFLRRLEELVADPKVTEQVMIGLAYSQENPILDSTLTPGRGVVTKAVLDDPVYGVVTDLLFRKRVAQDGVDLEKLAAKYSMTVGEAAAELGVSAGAVRQAIAAKRIASWLKGGQHFVDPRSLKNLEVGTRRPTKAAAEASAKGGAELMVCMGSKAGASFSVKSAARVGALAERAGTREGIIAASWKRLVVRSTGEGSKRAWVIVPGAEENEIRHGDFFVRGRFTIAEKSNNPKAADELWKSTQPE